MSLPSRAAALSTRASIWAISKISPAWIFSAKSLAHLMQTFEIEPEAVVHDLHPGYLSTSWAKEWAAERSLAAHRRAASPRAHRSLHGGARHRRAGDRLEPRRHRLRHRRPHLGRGSADRAVGWPDPGISSALRISITFPCPAARQRFASRGAWRLAACIMPVSMSNRRRCWRCSAQSRRKCAC